MKPPKWYFSVYGSGLGHISRSLWLADRLPGEKVFSTWGEALSLAKSRYLAVESPPLDVVWTEEGRMSFKRTLRGFHLAYSTFLRQVLREAENISRVGPDVVVSDSRLSPLIASRVKGRPSALIINQARVLLPLRQNVGLRIIERAVGELLGVLWGLADLVLVPDLPPPYTISANGLRVAALGGKKVFAGFFADPPGPPRFDVRERFGLEGRLVYIGISGPEPTRRFIFEKLLKAAELLPSGYSVVISKGYSGFDGSPVRFSRGLIFEWDPYRGELMGQADVVVSRAGLTTIGEAVMRGKPMVLIPISLHGEQIENAGRVRELGAGLVLDQYSATPRDIAEAIVTAAEDGRMRASAERLMRVALAVSAEERAKNALKEYL